MDIFGLNDVCKMNKAKVCQTQDISQCPLSGQHVRFLLWLSTSAFSFFWTTDALNPYLRAYELKVPAHNGKAVLTGWQGTPMV